MLGQKFFTFCSYYPPTKSDGYSFGVVHASVRPFCPSGFISQYLLVRFDSFLVQMIITMDSQYPISLVLKIVGSNNFSAQFIKIISHYKKIGYNINVLQQTACLVVNPITVGNFAFLFNCTPVGRTSDSMMVPT